MQEVKVMGRMSRALTVGCLILLVTSTAMARPRVRGGGGATYKPRSPVLYEPTPAPIRTRSYDPLDAPLYTPIHGAPYTTPYHAPTQGPVASPSTYGLPPMALPV